MAIREFLPFSRSLYGDGETKTVTLDFADQIAASSVCCGAPDEVVVSGDVKATVSGTKVSFEFSAAPAVGAFSVSGELLFTAKAEKEHKAADKEEKKHHTHR